MVISYQERPVQTLTMSKMRPALVVHVLGHRYSWKEAQEVFLTGHMETFHLSEPDSARALGHTMTGARHIGKTLVRPAMSADAGPHCASLRSLGAFSRFPSL